MALAISEIDKIDNATPWSASEPAWWLEMMVVHRTLSAAMGRHAVVPFKKNPARRPVKLRKMSIRFRKASATRVIYIAGRVFESGFDSDWHAVSYLNRVLDSTDKDLKDIYKVSRSEIETFLSQQPSQ